MRTPLKERGLVDIRTIMQQHIGIRFCISSDDHDDFNELVDEELTIIVITCDSSRHPGGATGQVEESNVHPLLALITIEPQMENVDQYFQTFKILTFTRQDYGLGIVAIFFHVSRVCLSS